MAAAGVVVAGVAAAASEATPTASAVAFSSQVFSFFAEGCSGVASRAATSSKLRFADTGDVLLRSVLSFSLEFCKTKAKKNQNHSFSFETSPPN